MARKKHKNVFRTKSLRLGGYSFVISAVVIAIAVVINLLVGSLPAAVTQIDTTKSGLFDLSEQTEQIVSGLNAEITVYWLVQEGKEDGAVEHMLARYKDLSDKLTVKKIDPIEYPTFAEQYTDETLYNNSLIVESGARSRYISYNEIYVTSYDYSTYYTTGEATQETQYCGENSLTSGIDYVISENLPKLYNLTGHGEAALSESFAGAVKNENIEIVDFSLLTLEYVPEDCDCLLVNSPASDLSEDELTKIKEYIFGGGNLLLITNYTGEKMPNVEALAEYYGCRIQEGIVIDSDGNHNLWGYTYYLLPDLNSHAITDPLINADYKVIMPIAQGILISDAPRDGVTVTTLLNTSDGAYSKLAGRAMTTYDYEEGDIYGPFALGAAITDASGEEEGKIIIYTTGMLLDETSSSYVSGANEDLFINSIGWMCERESAISIHSKALPEAYLSMETGPAVTITLIAVFIIPLAFLAAGLVIFVRRKRR